MQPLSAASCQHPFPTLVMLLGATNGAVVTWVEAFLRCLPRCLAKKPPDRTHLVHRGSRRHIHCAVGAREIKQSQRGWASRSARVHSIGMQSVTMPEFFYRCSPDWPHTEEAQMLHHRDIPSRAWRSIILNMDEGYEFLGALSVSAGGAAAGSKDTWPCTHASTLNTPLGTGKLQRSTRSGSYGSSNSAIVNLDLLENLHPEMLIKIERGLVGNHVQATKERFLFSAGRACKRHDALPDGFRLPAGVNSRWTRVWPRALAGTSITSPHTPPRMTSNHTQLQENDFPNIQESDNVGPAGGYIISSRDGVSLRISTGT